MKRILNPTLNPAGLSSAVLALYALGIGIWNVTHHLGAIDPQVIVAAVAAVAALFTRTVVTPVGDPKDGALRPLVPAEAAVVGRQVVEAVRAFEQTAPHPGYEHLMTQQVTDLQTALRARRAAQFSSAEADADAQPAPAPQSAPEPAARPVSSDPRERSAL